MAQLISVKLSRFDACPWGFRLQGGKDFGAPLAIQKVNGGSPAEKAGLQAGDAVVKVNDVNLFNLRHKEAQDALVRAGNNFELTVERGSSSTWKPQVMPVGPAPVSYNQGGIAPVTKTSLAAKQQEVQQIGAAHNIAPKPFGGAQVNGISDPTVKSIVNKQYNTPVGIYSEETIAETLSAQAEVLAGGVLGVNFMKNEKTYTANNSEVLKMVQEIDSEPRNPEPALSSSTSFFATSSHAVGGRATTPRPLTPLAQQLPPQSSAPSSYLPTNIPSDTTKCSGCERGIVGGRVPPGAIVSPLARAPQAPASNFAAAPARAVPPSFAPARAPAPAPAPVLAPAPAPAPSSLAGPKPFSTPSAPTTSPARPAPAGSKFVWPPSRAEEAGSSSTATPLYIPPSPHLHASGSAAPPGKSAPKVPAVKPVSAPAPAPGPRGPPQPFPAQDRAAACPSPMIEALTIAPERSYSPFPGSDPASVAPAAPVIKPAPAPAPTPVKPAMYAPKVPAVKPVSAPVLAPAPGPMGPPQPFPAQDRAAACPSPMIEALTIAPQRSYSPFPGSVPASVAPAAPVIKPAPAPAPTPVKPATAPPPSQPPAPFPQPFSVYLAKQQAPMRGVSTSTSLQQGAAQPKVEFPQFQSPLQSSEPPVIPAEETEAEDLNAIQNAAFHKKFSMCSQEVFAINVDKPAPRFETLSETLETQMLVTSMTPEPVARPESPGPMQDNKTSSMQDQASTVSQSIDQVKTVSTETAPPEPTAELVPAAEQPSTVPAEGVVSEVQSTAEVEQTMSVYEQSISSEVKSSSQVTVEKQEVQSVISSQTEVVSELQQSMLNESQTVSSQSVSGFVPISREQEQSATQFQLQTRRFSSQQSSSLISESSYTNPQPSAQLLLSQPQDRQAACPSPMLQALTFASERPYSPLPPATQPMAPVAMQSAPFTTQAPYPTPVKPSAIQPMAPVAMQSTPFTTQAPYPIPVKPAAPASQAPLSREAACPSPMLQALTIASQRSYSPLPSATKHMVSAPTQSAPITTQAVYPTAIKPVASAPLPTSAPQPQVNREAACPSPLLSALTIAPQRSYSPLPSVTKPGFAPIQAPAKTSFAPIQAPAKPSFAPTQAPAKPSFAPIQAPAKPSFAPIQAPAKPSFAPIQAPAKPSFAQAQATARPGFAPAQAPGRPGFAPAQAPARPGFAPAQAPARPGFAPAQAPAKPSFSPAKGPGKPSFAPVPAPAPVKFSPSGAKPQPLRDETQGPQFSAPTQQAPSIPKSEPVSAKTPSLPVMGGFRPIIPSGELKPVSSDEPYYLPHVSDTLKAELPTGRPMTPVQRALTPNQRSHSATPQQKPSKMGPQKPALIPIYQQQLGDFPGQRPRSATPTCPMTDHRPQTPKYQFTKPEGPQKPSALFQRQPPPQKPYASYQPGPPAQPKATAPAPAAAPVTAPAPVLAQAPGQATAPQPSVPFPNIPLPEGFKPESLSSGFRPISQSFAPPQQSAPPAGPMFKPSPLAAPQPAPVFTAPPQPAPAPPAPIVKPSPQPMPVAPVAATQPTSIAKTPSVPSSSSVPNAGGGGGAAPGGAQKGATVAGSTAPIRGRGVLTQQSSVPGRIPLCAHCNAQIRGPFITALGKNWCPEHFVCVNAQCRRPLADIGFVEEKGELYCEYCFEKYLAPTCNKCNNKIKGDCLNAIGKHFHPECFVCSYCGKLFGNNPFFLEDGLPYCEADWNELFTTKCFACGFPIEAGDRWVEALSNNYHSQCFNCTNCKKNLEGQSFYAKGGRPFCKTHAR